MQSRIVVSKVRSKILLIHLRACRYMRMINSLQNAGKVLSITLNIQESFYNQGKLGKAFFHLSTRKGFRSSRKGFVNLFPNLGKLLKILGKVSFQIFPKLPWERKGKGKLSVLPLFGAWGYKPKDYPTKHFKKYFLLEMSRIHHQRPCFCLLGCGLYW